MKNTSRKIGSFRTTKLQVISRKLAVIIAIATIFGLSMTACPTSSESNNGGGTTTQFEGTWSMNSDFNRLIISGNNWRAMFKDSPTTYIDYMRGTFTYTESQFNFIQTHEFDGTNWNPMSAASGTANYTLSGNTLTITDNSTFEGTWTR